MDNMKKNCWDMKNCGRQPGGAKSGELGVCSAATDVSCDSLNHGKNGGRICWAVAGTLCGGKVQGTFAEKHSTCTSCEVFHQIRKEEGAGFLALKPGQTHAKAKVS